MSKDVISLLGAVVPLVLVIVGLSQLLRSTNASNIETTQTLLKRIEKIQQQVGQLLGKVAKLEEDNKELKQDNDYLREQNKLWRGIARKWYQIAIAVNPALRDQVEDGLEAPEDF